MLTLKEVLDMPNWLVEAREREQLERRNPYRPSSSEVMIFGHTNLVGIYIESCWIK